MVSYNLQAFFCLFYSFIFLLLCWVISVVLSSSSLILHLIESAIEAFEFFSSLITFISRISVWFFLVFLFLLQTSYLAHILFSRFNLILYLYVLVSFTELLRELF